MNNLGYSKNRLIFRLDYLESHGIFTINEYLILQKMIFNLPVLDWETPEGKARYTALNPLRGFRVPAPYNNMTHLLEQLAAAAGLSDHHKQPVLKKRAFKKLKAEIIRE
jgi:hypothetical protein